MTLNITINNFGEFLNFISDQTYGFFGIGLLFLIFIVLFVNYYKQFKISVALFFSLISLLPIIAILSLLNLIPYEIIPVFLILLGLSAVYAYIKRHEY
ncbi:MAG: hypothetical protein QXL82_03120 [Candidatus Aenigmatarchaeota archaeon]